MINVQTQKSKIAILTKKKQHNLYLDTNTTLNHRQFGPCQIGLHKKSPSQIGTLGNTTLVKSIPGTNNLVKLTLVVKCIKILQVYVNIYRNNNTFPFKFILFQFIFLFTLPQAKC